MSKKGRLLHQVRVELDKEVKFGESKQVAKDKAKDKAEKENQPYEQVKGIYGKSTYTTYLKQCTTFVRWCMENHKNDIRNLSDCKQFVGDYLREKEYEDCSAWTIHTYFSAIARMYHTTMKEFDYDCPSRKRANIKRCRGLHSSDYMSPQDRYKDIKFVIAATGCRRMELLRLRPEDIKQKEDGSYVVHKRGKNKVERDCPIVASKAEKCLEILRNHPTYQIDGEERYFLVKELPESSVHDLRATYAADLYREYEEKGLGSGELYHCRREMLGKSFDKGILSMVSNALLHHRNSVVVGSYMYKL